MSLLTLKDFEKTALPKLPYAWREFIRNGGGDEQTLRENEQAYSEWVILPRFLSQDVSTRSLETTFLHLKTPVPFGVAPTGESIACFKSFDHLKTLSLLQLCTS